MNLLSGYSRTGNKEVKSEEPESAVMARSVLTDVRTVHHSHIEFDVVGLSITPPPASFDHGVGSEAREVGQCAWVHIETKAGKPVEARGRIGRARQQPMNHIEGRIKWRNVRRERRNGRHDWLWKNPLRDLVGEPRRMGWVRPSDCPGPGEGRNGCRCTGSPKELAARKFELWSRMCGLRSSAREMKLRHGPPRWPNNQCLPAFGSSQPRKDRARKPFHGSPPPPPLSLLP